MLTDWAPRFQGRLFGRSVYAASSGSVLRPIASRRSSYQLIQTDQCSPACCSWLTKDYQCSFTRGGIGSAQRDIPINCCQETRPSESSCWSWTMLSRYSVQIQLELRP